MITFLDRHTCLLRMNKALQTGYIKMPKYHLIITIVLIGLISMISCSAQDNSALPDQPDYQQSVAIFEKYYWNGYGGTIQNSDRLNQELLSKQANNPHAAFIYQALLLNGYGKYIIPSFSDDEEQTRDAAARSLIQMANNSYAPAAAYISEQSPKSGVGKRLFLQSTLTQQQYYYKIIDYIHLAEKNNFYCAESVYLLIFGEKHLFNDPEYDEAWITEGAEGSPLWLQQTDTPNADNKALLDKLITQLELSRDIQSSTYETQELINFYIDGLGQTPNYSKAYFWAEFIIAQYQPIKIKAPDHARVQIKHYQNLQKELAVKAKLTPDEIQKMKEQVAQLISQRQNQKSPYWQPQFSVMEQEPYTR